LDNPSRWDNPQPREVGVVANSTVSGLPLIEMVAVGSSKGQARVFAEAIVKIIISPINVPNVFTTQKPRTVNGTMDFP
jgi:hypothetical protein